MLTLTGGDLREQVACLGVVGREQQRVLERIARTHRVAMFKEVAPQVEIRLRGTPAREGLGAATLGLESGHGVPELTDGALLLPIHRRAVLVVSQGKCEQHARVARRKLKRPIKILARTVAGEGDVQSALGEGRHRTHRTQRQAFGKIRLRLDGCIERMHAPVSQLRGSCALGLRVQHRQLRQAPISKPGVVAVPLVVRFARGDGIGHVLQRARVFCEVAVLDPALRIAPLRILSVCRACTDAQDNGAEERGLAPVTAVFSVECVHMPDDITAPAARTATQSPALIDIGINLAHDSFDADRDAVIARAEAAGVAQMIVTGASLAGSAQASALSRAHPGRLFATAGVHPHHAAELDPVRAGELEELARRPEVVAVGECGLDYYRDYSPRAAQQRAFHLQLELALRLGKPVFLHQRDAHDDFVAILREHSNSWRGVAHCFTGDGAQLACYLGLGLAIGITGWICDERRGAHLAALMPQVPSDRLLLETDGPYLLPRDLKPKPASRRNEPAYLAHVAAAVARARGEPLAALAATSTAAAGALFALPAPATH